MRSARKHTVIKSVQVLERAGFLTVRRGGKRNAKGWSADVNEYHAQMPLEASGADAPTGPGQMPLEASKLFKSNGGGARKNAPTAKTICAGCDIDVAHNPHARGENAAVPA